MSTVTVPVVQGPPPVPLPIPALLIEHCRGRRVVVVCPAPGVVIPSISATDCLYAVNGGLAVIPRSMHVAFWQVNGRADRSSLRIEPTPLRLAWLDQGRQRHVNGLIVFMRDVEGFGTRRELDSRGLTYSWTVDIQKKHRALILDAISVRVDGKMNPSAGVMALAMLALAGAVQIVVCGFSWQTGYDYLPDHPLTAEPVQRKHVESDQIVLTALDRRYGNNLLRTTAPDLLAFGVRGV